MPVQIRDLSSIQEVSGEESEEVHTTLRQAESNRRFVPVKVKAHRITDKIQPYEERKTFTLKRL